MFIKFNVIRWKNFLGTGNSWIEIQLDKHEKTLIYGDNGAGKSTLLDALTFALFGKAFRNLNKPLLINSINGENCEVQLEFVIGTKQYKIVRGIKPNIFEIYITGKLQDQTGVYDYQDFLETNILKFNFKTFKQIMVLGSKSFVPFMKLPALDRRNVIEDLYDIQIFSIMAKIAKSKLDKCRDEITDIDKNISVTQEKIDLQKKNIQNNVSKNQERIDTNLQTIKNNNDHIKELENYIVVLSKDIAELQKTTNKKTEIQSNKQRFDKIESQIATKISTLRKEYTFFLDNDNCPTCQQEIDMQFREGKLKNHSNKLGELGPALDQLHLKIDDYTNQLLEINESLAKINNYQSQILLNKHNIEQLQAWEQRLLTENESLRNITFNAEKEDHELQLLNGNLRELTTKKQKFLVNKKHLEVASFLLKDGGIKTSIIKQYLPVTNNFINKYLSLLDFDVNFTLNENFEESIMARYRDKFAYENFSDGQQLRIDLALLFSWRSVAKVKNSVDTNILIMDEIVDSSLDNQGLEDFFKLISSMKESNIFIISPKGDSLVDKFDHTIKFELKQNFSEIVA